VVKLALPPLRNRREDIPLLADHFIRKFNRLTGSEIKGLSPEVLRVLMSHGFPGNVRELENIIEYATIVCKNGVVGINNLPDYLRSALEGSKQRLEEEYHDESLSWDELETKFILEVLKKNNWNRSATAAQLGVHTSTLWRKIKRLKIEVPKQSS
jgi:transcriptional regulator with PAS, ATPase and Fis domain